MYINTFMVYPERIKKNCVECNKEFSKPPSLARIKFCCDACYRMNRRRWKLSDEWKKNISEGTKKNLPSTAYKKGQGPWNKGKQLTVRTPQ